ncbi:serine hydroxymethyltransferase [Thermoproteota archaeon]
MLESFLKIKNAVKDHHKWKRKCLNLVASENVTSNSVREMIICDFGHRYGDYTHGQPSKRDFQGCEYIIDVELQTIELAKKLFHAEFVDVRPVSGQSADLAAIIGMTKIGDRVLVRSVPDGGHYTSLKNGPLNVLKRKQIFFPFSIKEMNIDFDKSIKIVRELKPKVVWFGGSVMLFPEPVRELKDVSREVGARILYDASHVFGLIAGGQFQDPFSEGADIMVGSAHKTIPGPQKGLILVKNDQVLADKIGEIVFPVLTDNHHMNNVAALGIALSELMCFGEEYAKQIIKNAKTLASSLYDLGFNVLCPDKGFTETHQIIVNVSEYGGGSLIAEKLEKANIITTRYMIPGDKEEFRDRPSGIRIGVSEVTRLGMKEDQMKEIAHLFKKTIIENEAEKTIKESISDITEDYNTVNYCFDENIDAYKFIKLIED